MKIDNYNYLFTNALPALWILLSIAVVTSLSGCATGSTQNIRVEEVAMAAEKTINSESQSPQKNNDDFELIDDRAYHYYVNGLIFEQMGDYVKAAKSLERARKFWSDSYEINFSYANVLLRLNQSRKALVILKNISPPTAEMFNLKAACYRLIGNDFETVKAYLEVVRIDSTDDRAFSFIAAYYRQANDLDSTLWAYQQLARLRPNNYRLHNEIGRLLELSGKNSEAKVAYQHSLEVNSDSTNMLAVNELANHYMDEGKLDSAISLLKVGLQMEPDNLLINWKLYGTYARMDSLELALTHALKVTELKPDMLMAFRMVGLLYMTLDSLDLADSVLTSLVARGDSAVSSHYYLGRVAFLKEDYNRARDEFQFVASKIDTSSSSWIDLAFTYQKLGQTKKEISTYKTGLKHVIGEDNKTRLLFGLAVSYERDDSFELSIETFEEVLAITPDNAQALNYLGYLLADRGEQLEYAEQLISRAIALVPDNAAFLDSFGWVHYKLGNIDLAIEYLEKAVKLDSDPVILDHLGDAYQAKGIIEEARIWWGKALELQQDNEEIRAKLNK